MKQPLVHLASDQGKVSGMAFKTVAISNPGSHSRTPRGRLRALGILAAAAAGLVALTTAPALTDTGAGYTRTTAVAAPTMGPGGVLDIWCTEMGGGMSSMSDGTEQCNL